MRLAASAGLAAAGLWTVASVLPATAETVRSGYLKAAPAAPIDEVPGFQSEAVIASNRAYDAGLKTLKDLLQAH